MPKDRAYWKNASDKANETLSELRSERDDLVSRVEELNAEILHWERVLTSLKPITSNQIKIFQVPVVDGVANEPLAEACRAILKKVQDNLTAKGIRNILAASGYHPHEKHTNALASIHGILKRLVESGEVEPLETDGKTFYRWKGFMMPPPQRQSAATKPLPDWYNHLTENGTRPLNFSRLTRRQRRRAIELGLDDSIEADESKGSLANLPPPKRIVKENKE